MEASALFQYFPVPVRRALLALSLGQEELLEIRLRAGRRLLLRTRRGDGYLQADGSFCTRADGGALIKPGILVTREMLEEMLGFLTEFSLYASWSRLGQGYLTIPGGHRVGVCGRVTQSEEGEPGMTEISSLNVRVAHEVKGCAEELVARLGLLRQPGNVLLVSPPGCGKTTMLRDMIRCIADAGRTVAVVDERSEIGAFYRGIPGNDLGECSDCLQGAGKRQGFELLLRSMGPEYIAVDELTAEELSWLLNEGTARGCYLLATLHGDVGSLPALLTQDMQSRFRAVVVLGNRNGPGSLEAMLESGGEK